VDVVPEFSHGFNFGNVSITNPSGIELIEAKLALRAIPFATIAGAACVVLLIVPVLLVTVIVPPPEAFRPVPALV
jgi:hypothetical protein